MFHSFKHSAIAASAIIASFGAATAAEATIYNVTSAGLYSYGTVNMAGTITGYGGYNSNVYAGALVLQGTTDGGQNFSVITFCFDLLHSINVGFNAQTGVSYSFSSQPVSTDLSSGGGNGNALTAAQIEQMSGLANLGAWMFTNNVSDLTARISAIQAAIWSVEYGLAASNFSAANASTYYADYLGRSFPGAATRVLVASDAQGQLIGNVQGVGLGNVPEPETWALMIVGFGLVGISSRRRKAATQVLA